jgi:hypothetical protein
MEEQNKDSIPIVQPDTRDLLKQATEAVAALKLENDRREAHIKDLKELEARKLLGGDSQSVQQLEVKPVETDKDYAKRIMQGRL